MGLVLRVALAAVCALHAVKGAAGVQLPLRASSGVIVDSSGTRVKLSCVNWSGAAQKDGVVGGLQFEAADAIAQKIASFGFNCVRIPWSVQMVHENWQILGGDALRLLKANPALYNSTTLDILDHVVDALSKSNLLVILDNHMSDADWCCSFNDENGLWWNERWSEQSWMDAHKIVAQRYASTPHVVGYELRNELRRATLGGKIYEPSWGDGNVSTDWAAAAKRAGDAILAIDSTALIVVDGLDYSTNLRDVKDYPVNLTLPHRLVYSAHDYSWSQPFKDCGTLQKQLDQQWGYITTSAPVWVSEFGTWHDGRDLNSSYWQCWTSFLRNRKLDFGYWRVDGTESRGSGRTFGAEAGFGIFDETWTAPAKNGVLLESLQTLM